jgi:hypothetical protein
MNKVCYQSAQLPLMEVTSWHQMQRTEFDGSPFPRGYRSAVRYCGRCFWYVLEGPWEIVVPYSDPDQEFSFAAMSERRHPLFEALFLGAVNRLRSA